MVLFCVALIETQIIAERAYISPLSTINLHEWILVVPQRPHLRLAFQSRIFVEVRPLGLPIAYMPPFIIIFSLQHAEHQMALSLKTRFVVAAVDTEFYTRLGPRDVSCRRLSQFETTVFI